jgi:hypothetical protein
MRIHTAERFRTRHLLSGLPYCFLMPLTPDDFFEHAIGVADHEGRLPLSRMTDWEVFPFESDGLRVVPLAKPVLPEPPRYGEGGVGCRARESERTAL